MASFELIELKPCGECGMPCKPGEFHPYAACLMFKGCHDSTTVRANLSSLSAGASGGGEGVSWQFDRAGLLSHLDRVASYAHTLHPDMPVISVRAVPAIAEKYILPATTPASPATGQVAAGCAHVWVPGQAGMMYCDQCGRQKPAATPQPESSRGGVSERTIRALHLAVGLDPDKPDGDALLGKVCSLAAAPNPQQAPAQKCERCNGHGVIGYTTGQTPESFEQHTVDCPDCTPPAHGDGEGLSFEPDERHTVADMANVGYALMQAIARNRPDYVWSECPSEIVCDLINERDEIAVKAHGYMQELADVN